MPSMSSSVTDRVVFSNLNINAALKSVSEG